MMDEILANIKTAGMEIMFRMDSGYFDDDGIESMEFTGRLYLIKGKEYPPSLLKERPPLFLRKAWHL
jgi:hypothetical protein